MFDPELEELIDAIIADGQLSEREERVLMRKAEEFGEDPEEVMVIVEAKLHKMRQNAPQTPPPPPQVQPQQQTWKKVGTISKCPSCGAEIRPGHMQCESCGYEIHGLGVINSMRELDKRLIANSKDNRADIITGFPVPNNREDLIEFMIAMKSRAGKFDHYNATKDERAYALKYFECSEKAHFYFGSDKQFAPLLRESVELRTKWEQKSIFKEIRTWWRGLGEETRETISFLTTLIGLPIFLLFLLYLIAR